MKSANAIRWTLATAANEFGLDRKTMAKRAKAAGIVPGPDGKFSTKEVHGSICTDYEKERARKMKEDADAAAIANAKEREELFLPAMDTAARVESKSSNEAEPYWAEAVPAA